MIVQPYSFEKSYKRSCKCRDCSQQRDIRGIKHATRFRARLELVRILEIEVLGLDVD